MSVCLTDVQHTGFSRMKEGALCVVMSGLSVRVVLIVVAQRPRPHLSEVT